MKSRTASPVGVGRVARAVQGAALGSALEQHIRAIVREEIQATSAQDDDWVDQTSAPIRRKKFLELVRQGELQGRKVGRQVLVRRSELDAYLEAHKIDLGAEERAASKARDEMDAQLERLGFVG